MKTRNRKPGFQTATLLAGAIMLMIIFVSAGYILTLQGTDPVAARDPQLAELDSQRKLWERRRPDAFEYVVDRSCDCSAEFNAPYRAIVGDAGTLFRFDIDDGGSVTAQRPPEPADIGQLFNLVEAALVSGRAVQVFYDSDYGYPAIARIGTDGYDGEQELAFDVRDFRTRR